MNPGGQASDACERQVIFRVISSLDTCFTLFLSSLYDSFQSSLDKYGKILFITIIVDLSVRDFLSFPFPFFSLMLLLDVIDATRLIATLSNSQEW